MKRWIAGAGVLFVVSGAALGQTPVAKPAFEVASVKVSPPPAPNMMRIGCTGGPGTTDPGLWTCNMYSLDRMIASAYDLKRYQFDAPVWMRMARFDISAKVPPGTTKAQFLLMQQSLLEERFKLALHREQKEMPTYELTVGKSGSKMKEAERANADSQEPEPAEPPRPKFKMGKDGIPELVGPGMIGLNGHMTWNAPDISMEEFVAKLSDQVNRPVVDATGLKGRYDVSLHWEMESMTMPGTGGASNGAMAMPADPSSGGPTLERAVQDQLGLKLESKKGMAEIVVIDHVERVPIEN